MIDKIKLMREQGYSYSEIAKKVNKSKKFVWKKSHNIKFSNVGKERYKNEVRGILKEINPQEDNLSLTKVRILGHILFDGCLYEKNYRSVVKYINSSKELINQFINDTKNLYGLNPTSLEIEEKSYITNYKVTFVSKLLLKDLKKYFNSYSPKSCFKIPEEIMNGSRKMKIELLRAFWEDEGSISINGRLMADQKNKDVINQLSKLHEEFGFSFKVCKYLEPTGIMYKIYFLKNINNLKNFYNLKLFDKSIVTHGKNINKKKIDILKSFI